VKKHFEKKLSLVKNKIGFEKGGKKEEEIVFQFYYINSVFPLYNNNTILT